MTRLLYLEDPYLEEFQARILRLEGDWVELDQTAFYPGGGGQEHDLGWIGGKEVTKVRRGEGVMHRVPGHSFTEGESVDCLLDWDRRSELMMAHTAEHMIFAALSRSVDGMELVKISITRDKKSVVIKGALDWDILLKAQEMVNRLIETGASVECHWVKRDDPLLGGIRVKLDRIQGEEVRIVKIGDFDIAACGGIHVRNASEIGCVIITSFTSAMPAGDLEVEFEVGEKARWESLRLAGIALKTSGSMGSRPENLRSAVENLKESYKVCEESLRGCFREKLDSLEPQQMGGAIAYSGMFSGVSKKDLLAAANRLVRESGRACVLLSSNGGMIMVVARSPDLGFDCRRVLDEALKEIGGRGGGRPDFAFGGATSNAEPGKALESAMDILRRFLIEG